MRRSFLWCQAFGIAGTILGALGACVLRGQPAQVSAAAFLIGALLYLFGAAGALFARR